MNPKQERRRTQLLLIVGSIFFIAFVITVATNTPEAWRALSGLLALFVIAFLIYSSWCSWKNRGLSNRHCNWWRVGVVVFLWFIANQLSISGFVFNETKLSDSTAGYALDLADNWALAAEALKAERGGDFVYYLGLSDQKYKTLRRLAESSEYKILNKATSTCDDALNNLDDKLPPIINADVFEICAQAYRDAAGDVTHAREIPITPVPLSDSTAGYILDMANDLSLAAEAAREGREGGYLYYMALHEQKSGVMRDLANISEFATIGKALQFCVATWKGVPYSEASTSLRTDALAKCINAYQDTAGDVTHIKEIPLTPVPLSATTAGYALDLANNWMLAAEAAKADRMSTAEYFSKLSDEKAIILADMIESGEEILLWKAFQTCEDVMVDAPISSPLIIADIFEICAQAYRDAAGDVTHAKVIPFTPIPLSDSTARYVLDMADGLAKAAEAARSENRNELVYYMDSYEQQYGTLYNTTKPGEDVVVLKADLICEDAFNTLTDDSLLSDLADAIEDCVQAYYDVADMKQ